MAKSAVDVRALSRDQQLELLDQLWEEVGHEPSALPLSDGDRSELDRRLDELEREGPVGILWDEVVKQIRSRTP